MEENYNLNNEMDQERMMQDVEKKNRLQGLSPEEARQKAKESVAKAVALGAGALEGVTHYTEPKIAGDAARVAAKTVKNTIDTVKDELPERKPKPETFSYESGSSEPGMMSQVGSSVKEGASTMKERIGEQASHLRESASMKAGEFRDRSKEGFQHLKQDMKEHSADEIRQKARETVGRGISRGTGALEGVIEQADPDLPSEAVKKVADTVREASNAVKEEVNKGKSSDSSIDGSTSTSGGI